MLSKSETASYHENGLVIPDCKLSESILYDMQKDLSEFLPKDPEKAPDFVPDLMECGFGLKYGSSPQILDVVEQLIGSDFALWACGLFGKPARVGKETPWHQDGHYWAIKPLATCTVWLAFDNSGMDNGCLKYIAGSHKAKTLWKHNRVDNRRLTLNQVLDPGLLPENLVRHAVLQAGQFSVHDVYLIHGSEANHSSDRRAGITFRYMPTTSFYDHDYAFHLHQTLGVPDISKRTLYLMRGIDRCGLNKF